IQVAQINAQTQQYKAQAEANSQALQAAYKSGNPSGIAAASTTPADAQNVDALSTAAKVLF
ncbi:MAG: hypothetical protein LBG76_10525, partial [Treponema sp.]|nr:hypothetical protein [Treponema sp.]